MITSPLCFDSRQATAGAVEAQGGEQFVVYRGVTGGWQDATTDAKGFYQISGLNDGTEEVSAVKTGYQTMGGLGDGQKVIRDSTFD
jgi:hypothetical protein